MPRPTRPQPRARRPHQPDAHSHVDPYTPFIRLAVRASVNGLRSSVKVSELAAFFGRGTPNPPALDWLGFRDSLASELVRPILYATLASSWAAAAKLQRTRISKADAPVDISGNWTAATLYAATADQVAGRLGLAPIQPSALVYPGFPVAPPITLNLDWHLTNQAAVDAAANQVGTLITNLDAQALEVVRGFIAEGFVREIPPTATARMLVGVVGLNRPQEAALSNYVQGQIAGFKPADGEAVPVNYTQVAERAAVYADKLESERALTISRTETIRASASGQEALWDEAVRQGYLKPFPNNGQIPPLHPSCRCSVALSFDGDQPRRVWIAAGNACPLCMALAAQMS